MSSQSIVTGYYGKIPANGDFVSRGLPNTFINPWDIWLQEALYTSRKQLGNEWLDFYLTSPIYRFVLSPGICGDSTWMGIMMPSVDKIGRYYPVTVSRKTNYSADPFTTFQENNTWYAQIEQLARSCLKDDFDLEKFYRDICQTAQNLEDPIKDKVSTKLFQCELTFPNALMQPLTSLETLPYILPSILDRLLKDHYFAYSIWSTKGSEYISPTLLVCMGLPPFDGLSAMFDGKWNKWGWEGDNFSL